jgi:hypothetical protein
VATHFALDATFSSAALGAARFAAAATGSTELATVRFAERDYEIHRVPASEGETAGACRRRAGGMPVAFVDARGRIRFDVPDDEPLSPSDALVAAVVGAVCVRGPARAGPRSRTGHHSSFLLLSNMKRRMLLLVSQRNGVRYRHEMVAGAAVSRRGPVLEGQVGA